MDADSSAADEWSMALICLPQMERRYEPPLAADRNADGRRFWAAAFDEDLAVNR
jgi:hypothetical protein